MKLTLRKFSQYFAVFFFIAALSVSCQSRPEPTTPTVQRISESVYASGIVRSMNQYNVYSTVVGRIDSIYIPEGQFAKSGDILMTLRNETASLNVLNSDLAARRADLRNNQARIETGKAAIELARTTMNTDSVLFVRQKNLWSQGIGSRVELEQRQLAFERSSSNYKNALLSFDNLMKDLQFSSEQSRNALMLSKSLAGDYAIRASIGGKVFRQFRKKGELVSTASPVAVIGDAASFIVELSVDEHDIALIASGQKVFVTMDSYRKEVFEATVYEISPMMNEESRSFVVKASFVNAPEKLYPGLSVEANILIRFKDSALTIPRALLASDTTVFLANGELRHVTVGLKDYNWVEIVEGLEKDDQLSAPKP